MARCGCSAGCACLVVGAGPVLVTGNGSPGSPFVVTLSEGGFTGCKAITACVGENLGPGLAYDPNTGTIQAQVSRDAGNTLTFGSDNGLFGTGTGGGGATCAKSVTGLPVLPNLVVGAESLAGLMGPFNSPYQLDYCLSAGVDFVHFGVAATADADAWVSDSTSGQVTSARTNLYGNQYARYMDSSAVRTAWSYAGDLNDPFPGVTGSNRVFASGWYGYMTPNHFMMMIGDALKQIGARSVAVIDCQTQGAITNQEATNVAAALRAIRQQCAQTWSMVGFQDLAQVSTINLAGTTALYMSAIPVNWGTTTHPTTPAALTAVGCNWIALHENYADSVFNSYRTAGFNVIMQGANRQVDRARVVTLGIRGFMSFDPVYTRGPGVVDYRRIRNPWAQRRMGVGQLSHLTDQGFHVGTIPRGYFAHPPSGSLVAPPGLYIPPGFGNGGGTPLLLCGWECPLIAPTSYTISVDMMFDTLPIGTTGKLGLLFAMADDSNIFQYNGSDGNPRGYPAPVLSFYRAYQRVNGEIGLINYTAGVTTTLATLASPAPATGLFNTYLLTVTPTTITWKRTLGGGTTYSVTATNSARRGPYFGIEKEELNPGNTQFQFRGVFDNLVVTGQESD